MEEAEAEEKEDTGADKMPSKQSETLKQRTDSTTVVQALDKRLVPGSNPGSCKLHLGVVHQQNARFGNERHQGRHLALRYLRLAKTAMQWIATPPCGGANPPSQLFK